MSSIISYFVDNMGTILNLTGEHLVITAITVGIAILIGVPLGISVYYFKRTSKLVLGIANIIQAIPSLALLGFMIPLLGIGKLPAIVVVTLYSLLPIIKNTYIGINNINPNTIEAAVGMGLTKKQILTKIQLPIALPVIMTGVRIAAVTAVGVVTVAAFIGGGGLGFLIFSGIRTVNNEQIIAGAVPACILALIVDGVFGKIEEKLSYKRVSGPSNKKVMYGIFAALAIAVVGGLGYNTYQNSQYDMVVGGKDFTEQSIIASIAAEVIEDQTDLKVKRELNLGGSSIAYEAMVNGNIDMYLDYTGTMYVSILKQDPISDTNKVFDYVKKEFDKVGLYVSNSIGFNNTYTISVLPEFAKKHDLKTLSDLKKVASDSVVAATLEFVNRQDGLPGLEKLYGFKFKSVTPVDGSLRFSALENGSAQAIDAFSTDGLISKFNLTILEDDKHYFPPYYAVPVIRNETLEKFPELKDVLKTLENIIDEEEMQKLNYKVDEEQQDPEQVAKEWLVEKGIITE
ncbi:glycine betaine ABC transporter substrate-binding protein [Mycoplasma sp. P36-A1]|uniref:ABC transporter permease/substrate-binding protein n=1 Tax=Mycoplasma sp. P36-A1 TaxID=3252900 RepID=UPI003C2E070E